MPSNKQALKEMPDEYVICRMLKHNWTFKGFHRGELDGRRWTVLELECGLCDMERHDYLDARGELVYRYYSRPDGYNIVRKKNERREGRIPLNKTRTELMARHPIKSNGKRR